jgi:hypothetical protein
MMNENNHNRSQKETNFMGVGIAIGALMSLLFAKTGNPGLMGVGVAIGIAFGEGLNRRFGTRKNVEGG